MRDYLDKKHEARKIASNAIGEIYFLARSFNVVGNEKVSEDLKYFAKDLETAMTMYEESFDELFNNAYNATQQATVNMVQAALNVALKK